MARTIEPAQLLADAAWLRRLAVRLAEESGITLAGFARGSRLVIYSHPEYLAAEGVAATRPLGQSQGSASQEPLPPRSGGRTLM